MVLAIFKTRLNAEKASAIDMECSALFTAGFKQKVPVGALMLISDLPLRKGGIKTKKSSKEVFKKYTKSHLEFGIASLKGMQEASEKEQDICKVTAELRHVSELRSN